MHFENMCSYHQCQQEEPDHHWTDYFYHMLCINKSVKMSIPCKNNFNKNNEYVLYHQMMFQQARAILPLSYLILLLIELTDQRGMMSLGFQIMGQET